MSRLSLSFFLITFFLCCGDDGGSDRADGYSNVAESPQDSLFQAVMDGHDIGIARMGKLKGYRKQVEQELDSLKKSNPRLSKEIEGVYIDIRNKLQEAEAGMNKWMDEFKIDSAENELEERMKYLQHEKLKVDKVKNDILSTLERADSLLQRNSAEEKK